MDEHQSEVFLYSAEKGFIYNMVCEKSSEDSFLQDEYK